MKKELCLILLTVLFLAHARAQAPHQIPGNYSGASILQELKSLQNTQRVLYLAAHPDDENTRLIAWLENSQKVRTAYLSLTRGSGGQNLIGPELGAALGVLRTQELLQARKIDGGEQYFTRAVDFGYSKTARETFDFWDKKEVLRDVVKVIREFKPDIIITRFPADARAGHGHHTASAILAQEAFDLAASADAFPEQLSELDTWQCRRIYWNHSTWWNQDLDSIAQADPSYIKVEVGEFVPALGMSCNEIASHSRTQHKSQGFGVSVARGSQYEYLRLLKGEASESLFGGISPGWKRFGWPEGDRNLKSIIAEFDLNQPAKSVPALLELWETSGKIENLERKEEFRRKLYRILQHSLGLYAELRAPAKFSVQGEEQALELSLIQRAGPELHLNRTVIGGKAENWSRALPLNEEITVQLRAAPLDASSQPYWLARPFNYLYQVADYHLVGQPENHPALAVELHFDFPGQVGGLVMNVPAYYKTTDRVQGDVYEPVLITHPVIANPETENLIFVDREWQKVKVNFHFRSQETALIEVKAEGWEVEPQTLRFEPRSSPDMQQAVIKVRPEKALPGSEELTFELKTKPAGFTNINLFQRQEIDYPHVEKRVLFKPAQVQATFIDLKKKEGKIGYIPGAGDKVKEAIELMGYEVELLDADAIRGSDLSQYRTIVAGIRAYNTQDWLPEVQQRLMQYVENGGTYLVQYNTRSYDLNLQKIGPFPFKISRKRVTEEDAAVRFHQPGHPILNEPNKITQPDFDHWVQERGLYFADDWSDKYATPLAWHDEGEDDLLGGLLIADYGKGAFIYTGISFFRELPAGVPGAYRLMANLISYKPEP